MGLRDLLVDLEDIVNCVVCLERLGASTMHCVNGHGFCRECTLETKECPTCERPMLANKPTLLTQILERLPELCKYSIKGCEDVSLSGDHEPFCIFRPFNCMLNECCWQGAVWGLKKHLESRHCRFTYKYSFNQPIPVRYPSFEDQGNSWESVRIIDNNLFLFITMKDEQTRFLQWIKFVPIGKPKHVYYFATSFLEDNIIVFKYTNKAEIWEEKELEKDSPYCMIMPLKELERFIESDGSLKGTVTAVRVELSKSNK